ncbi:hypothetical protein [Microtetraspora fusca]|uniref:Uncharacterized protein n=1 Tax=Microtetraspora fusca TaxID=1997 RepID=A0ABW6VKS2_MICFU|nr:hypothetical protein [Microtetraspora fusca]
MTHAHAVPDTGAARAVQEEAAEELAPLIGRRAALRACGVPQATWYRKNRKSPAKP